jgi:hypothetical protein
VFAYHVNAVVYDALIRGYALDGAPVTSLDAALSLIEAYPQAHLVRGWGTHTGRNGDERLAPVSD